MSPKEMYEENLPLMDLNKRIMLAKAGLEALSRDSMSINDLMSLIYLIRKNRSELLPILKERNNLDLRDIEISLDKADFFLVRNVEAIFKEYPHILTVKIATGRGREEIQNFKKTLFNEILPYLKEIKKMEDVHEIEKLITISTS